eukprot:5616446-Amphidinium_carterae.2
MEFVNVVDDSSTPSTSTSTSTLTTLFQLAQVHVTSSSVALSCLVHSTDTHASLVKGNIYPSRIPIVYHASRHLIT